MVTELRFCKSWFWNGRVPTEVWSTDKAAVEHVEGRPYTVIVGDEKQPTHIIEITSKFIAVSFMDKLVRPDLVYRFRELSPNQFFLVMAVHRVYAEDTNDVAEGSSYEFSPDGKVHIRKEIYAPSFKAETAEGNTDVSGNYAVRPNFGEYDGLLPKDRPTSGQRIQ